MVPAGVRLDLADGTLCFPEEVLIHLAGGRPAYRSKIQNVKAIGQHVVIPAEGSQEVNAMIRRTFEKLWVT